jgi:diamine N-acetyltransferase
VLGEAIGHISYSQVNGTRGAVELDIWLRSEGDCGRGYGSDALATLTDWLIATLHMTEFVIRPSRRNQRAIRAYAKAGFQVAKITTQKETATYGPPDYGDALVMRLEKPA